MKAERITRFKSVSEEGGGMELAAWRVPGPFQLTEHDRHYRVACAVASASFDPAAQCQRYEASCQVNLPFRAL
jgi:hypothetical protein